MPLRDITPELAAHFAQRSTSLALCVKLTRLDGQIIGFTTLDRSFSFDDGTDSVDYFARSSFDPSAIRTEAGGGVDNLDFVGLLTSEIVTDTDLLAGRYDGARIEIFLVNYRELTQGRMLVVRGTLGEVSLQDRQFHAEIRSKMQQAQQNVGELTSALCRVKQLGDARCKVDLTGFRFSVTVAVIDSVYRLRFANSNADDYFTYGVLEAVDGANAGFKREIKDHFKSGSNAVITVQETFPFVFEVGDACVLEAGCDRRSATCRDRFDNILNFRGEPFIPGTDKVLKRGRK